MKMKISVIVPVYNVQAYLAECLDSLLNQTYDNLEVLIVNDGSTDQSAQIAQEYVQRYPHRFTLLHKVNGGLSDARNFAIDKVTGDWIAFLDSDDVADTDYYQTMAEVMEQGMDVVVSNIEYFYENGKPSWIMSGLNPHHFDTIWQQAFLSPMFAWNKLYKKEFFLDLGYRYPVNTWYEDIPVTMPIFALSKKIGWQTSSVIHYRQREGSIMSVTQGERLKEIFPVMKLVRDQFEKLNIDQQYANELEYLHIEHLRLYGMFRFLRSSLSVELTKLSDEVMLQHYPQWKKNPYIQQLGLKNRIFLKTYNLNTLPFYKKLIR